MWERSELELLPQLSSPFLKPSVNQWLPHCSSFQDKGQKASLDPMSSLRRTTSWKMGCSQTVYAGSCNFTDLEQNKADRVKLCLFPLSSVTLVQHWCWLIITCLQHEQDVSSLKTWWSLRSEVCSVLQRLVGVVAIGVRRIDNVWGGGWGGPPP